MSGQVAALLPYTRNSSVRTAVALPTISSDEDQPTTSIIILVISIYSIKAGECKHKSHLHFSTILVKQGLTSRDVIVTARPDSALSLYVITA